MTVAITITNDARHPEGGHALVCFPGLTAPTGVGRLRIEPLSEESARDASVEVDVIGTATPEGLIFAVGAGVLDILEVGTAVAVSIAGTGVSAETVWPDLPSLRQAPSKTTLRPPPKTRTIVEPQGTKTQPVRAPQREQTTEETQRVERPTQVVQPEPKQVEPMIWDQETTTTIDPPKVQTGLADATKPAPRSLWAAFAGAGLAAGVLLGVVGGHFLWPTASQAGPQPALTPPTTEKVSLAFPSPYDLLEALPVRHSFGHGAGSILGVEDPIELLQRIRPGQSDEENSFWSRWALRLALNGPSGQPKANHGVAFALTFFADDMYHNATDPGSRALAEYLWELAAVGSNCRAMDQLAEVTKASHDPGATARAATWKTRSDACKAQRQ